MQMSCLSNLIAQCASQSTIEQMASFLGWGWSQSALSKHIWSLFRWQFILAQNILQKSFFLLNKWGNLNGSNWLCRPWRHLVTALINKTFEHVGVPNMSGILQHCSQLKKKIPDVQIFTALPSMTAVPTYLLLWCNRFLRNLQKLA